MTLHRRQLPIASPCQAFEGTPASESTPAFCTRCDKHVHDLSRLTEPQVVELLARHVDERLCVSYRTRTDGTIALRRPPPRLAPATFALSLAGCAGHLADEPADAKGCVDPAGYGIDCPPQSRLGLAVIPDSVGPTIDEENVDDGATLDDAELVQDGEIWGGIQVSAGDLPTFQEVVDGRPVPTSDATAASTSDERVGDRGIERGDIMVAGGIDAPSASFQRRIRREAKRIARREARTERRRGD